MSPRKAKKTKSSTVHKVRVISAAPGTNERITAMEASEMIGCSYPHLINMINRGKLPAIRKGKFWILNLQDVVSLIDNREVRPRPKTSDVTVYRGGAPSSTRSGSLMVSVGPVAKQEFDTVTAFLQGKIKGSKGKLVEAFLLESFNEAHKAAVDAIERASLPKTSKLLSRRG